MKKKWTKMLSGLLCVAMLAAMAIPASAAGYATSESGKNNEGVSYTVKYPKIYGIINAEINMVDDSEDGIGTIVKKVQLPVMASGEAFELVFTSGLTSTRCPDCDKPYPDPNEKNEPSHSMANGTLYDGPCMHVILLSNTNPTEGYDSGTVALVLASDNATIHFVDYSLAPKESKTYSVAVAGHMAIEYGHQLTLLDGGWGEFLNADIITFESDEDLAAYRAAIPYEQNDTWMVTQGSGDGENANVVVCDGTTGDAWLKNYTGIQRHNQIELDPNISHNICKAGGK